MPSRKKCRLKQRTSRRDPLEEKVTGGASAAREMISSLKAEGCRISFREDGSTIVSYPGFHPGADRRKLIDRSLLDDESLRSIADNYVHNYAWELREGEYHGTRIIVENLMDIPLMPRLSEALAREDIHEALLRFLGQCRKNLPLVLHRNDYNAEIPWMWMDILRVIIQHGGCADDIQLALARGIQPLVMCMMDNKRELFKSKRIWHTALPFFFALVHSIMLSREGFRTIVENEGLVPFIAQACSWSQSREDIVAESTMLRIPVYSSIETACYSAQRVICLVVDEYYDINTLEQIAYTPLLSNNPNCVDSTIVGMIRMISIDQDISGHRLSSAIAYLLFSNCVDSHVITELIECGRGGSSHEAAHYALYLIRGILGLDEENDHIRRRDIKCATAVSRGLIELCIQALVPGDNEVRDIVCDIVRGLYSMALHKETSQALRKRRPLLKKYAHRSDHVICPIISDSLELGTPICCNCLKDFDRKNLHFCKCCKVECYCSRDCQLQSWNAGHKRFCKDMANDSKLTNESARMTGIKRLEVLKNNLMMSGCRFVKNNIDKIAGLKAEKAVIVDFQQHPPAIKLGRNDTSISPSQLEFTFVSQVASKVRMGAITVDKAVPIQSLAIKDTYAK